MREMYVFDTHIQRYFAERKASVYPIDWSAKRIARILSVIPLLKSRDSGLPVKGKR